MKASMVFESPDSTELMNGMVKDILPLGVYLDPGTNWIQKVDNSNVQINPGWVVRNKDGMTIREDSAAQTVSLSGSAPYYVGLYSRYAVAKDPILQLMAVSKSTYDSTSFDAQRPHFVIFASVGLYADSIDYNVKSQPVGSVFALLTDLNLALGSSVIRFISDTHSFPNDPQYNEMTGAGEVVYVMSENAFYVYQWTSSSWIRVDDPCVGSANFVPAIGVEIAYPTSVITDRDSPSQDNHTKVIFIHVTPTSASGGHLGEYWVEKGATSFMVKHTGNSTASFDWMITVK
jgi:hypothetical protein